MPRLAAVAFLSLALMPGCTEGKRFPAVGPGNEIVVLSSGPARGLGTAVAEILSREVRIVHFEPAFVTVDDHVDELSFYRKRKMLFLVGDPEDPKLRKALRRASGTRTRTSFPGLWIEVEPFSAGQVMFILTGPLDTVTRSLITRQDELLEIVEDAAVTLLTTNLFRAGEATGARERMLDRWGWGVRLPPEWVVDDRFADRNFVRVWHDAPVEQLFVSWEDGLHERTPDEWLARRDKLVREYYDGDEVVFDWCVGGEGPTPFTDQGVFLKGLWENDEYVIGGPFRSWAFICPEDGRTYFVDYSVYAPDRPKKPLLRVLEAVGRTFRCGCVPAPGPSS